MAKLDYYRTMEHFKQILAKNLEEGENITDFVRRIGEDELTGTLGIGSNNAYYVNTVYRTVSAQAYSAGKYISVMDNEQIIMLEFIAVVDQRTTEEICLPTNGTTLPKNNVFWDSHWPPLHLNCRSDIVEYTQAFVDAFDINEFESADVGEAEEGFGRVENYRNGDWVKPPKFLLDDLSAYE